MTARTDSGGRPRATDELRRAGGDFLQRLALRTLAPEPLAQPRGTSLFEPVAEPAGAALAEIDETVEARPLPRPRAPRRAPRPGRETPAPPAAAPSELPAPAPPTPPREARAADVDAAPATRPVRRRARPSAHALESAVPADAGPRARAEPSSEAPDPVVARSPSPPDQAPADAVPADRALVEAAPRLARDSSPVALAAEPETVTLVERILEAPAPPAAPRRSSPARREPAPAAATEPTVHVSIGRIEVRAVAPPAAPAPPRRAATAPSLEDYLRERAG